MHTLLCFRACMHASLSFGQTFIINFIYCTHMTDVCVSNPTHSCAHARNHEFGIMADRFVIPVATVFRWFTLMTRNRITEYGRRSQYVVPPSTPNGNGQHTCVRLCTRTCRHASVMLRICMFGLFLQNTSQNMCVRLHIYRFVRMQPTLTWDCACAHLSAHAHMCLCIWQNASIFTCACIRWPPYTRVCAFMPTCAHALS